MGLWEESGLALGVEREIESPKLRVEHISKHKKAVGRPVRTHVSLVSRGAGTRGEERAYEEIIAVLRRIVGVDFTDYKRLTIDRRIQRRMKLQGLETLRQYTDHLSRHLPEVHELFNDILIHMTGFFRDHALFTTLKKTIFPKTDQGTRPGCRARICGY